MRRMMPWLLAGSLGLAGAVLAPAANANEQHENETEQQVTLDQLPPSVRAAVEKEATGQHVEELEKETKNGAVHYEAELTSGNQETKLEISPDGQVTKRKVKTEQGNENQKEQNEQNQ